MKSTWVTGPKCVCGYGANFDVPLVEQSDIDAAVAEVEAEMGRPVTDFERAMIALPIKKQGVFGRSEEDVKRDHMRQAPFVLAAHVNEDGSCPGQPGKDGKDTSAINLASAKEKNYEQRLELAEKVTQRHGGEINPNAGTETPTLDELKAEKTKEKARPK